jgi:hypothetical protein
MSIGQNRSTISVDRMFARSHSASTARRSFSGRTERTSCRMPRRTQVRECNWDLGGPTGAADVPKGWQNPEGWENYATAGGELRDGLPLKPGSYVTAENNASVPPRRAGQQNDAALHEAVRAHWREVVRRVRPADNTARLDLDVDNDVDNTALLDPDTVAVKPSVPPGRAGPQNDAALHEAVRVRGPGGDVVRREPPVDNTAGLDPDTRPVKPLVPPGRA